MGAIKSKFFGVAVLMFLVSSTLYAQTATAGSMVTFTQNADKSLSVQVGNAPADTSVTASTSAGSSSTPITPDPCVTLPDPIGDAIPLYPNPHSTVDITSLTVCESNAGGTTFLNVTWTFDPATFDPAQFSGEIDIDLDRDISTGGETFLQFAGGPAVPLGVEYLIDFSLVRTGYASVLEFYGRSRNQLSYLLLGQVPFSVSNSSVTASIPMPYTWRDECSINFVGTSLIKVSANGGVFSDYVPNSGFGVLAITSADTTAPKTNIHYPSTFIFKNTDIVPLNNVIIDCEPLTLAEWYIQNSNPSLPPFPPALGKGTPLALPSGVYVGEAPLSSITTTGYYYIQIRAKDASGNISTTGFLIYVTVPDTIPPVISNVAIAPNPTRVNPTLTATMMDDATDIMAAEYFIDSTPPSSNVRGTPMFASDGTFDQLQENVTAVINISVLADGTHTVIVRGEDAAGNWSQFTSTTFVIDRTPPKIDITYPQEDGFNFTITDMVFINFTMQDPNLPDGSPGSGVVSYSIQINNTPYQKSVTVGPPGDTLPISDSLIVDACKLSPGTYTATVKATDEAGNEGMATRTFNVIVTAQSLQKAVMNLLANDPSLSSYIARINQLQNEINNILSGNRSQDSIKALIDQINSLKSDISAHLSILSINDPCVPNIDIFFQAFLAQVTGSVKIKGPPAICDNETATYSAIAFPGGGTFKWSKVSGDPTLRFSDETTATTTITGLLSSIQDNEEPFTIKVEYMNNAYNDTFDGIVAKEKFGGNIVFHLVTGTSATPNLDAVNNIWGQACIHFAGEGKPPSSQPEGFTKEQLKKFAAKEFENAPALKNSINVYFIKSFDVSLANILAFQEPIDGVQTIFISDGIGETIRSDDRTLAHELGHVLQLPNTFSDTNNLMYASQKTEGIGSGTDLTLDQVKDARTHAE